jgi:hypothetical protein
MTEKIWYKFDATLTWGGDIQTGEAEVTCRYTVSWGRPAVGPSYDHGGLPADDDEIDNIEILEVDGKKWDSAIEPYSYGGRNLAEAHESLCEKLLMDCYDDMIENAVAHDVASEMHPET